MFLAEIKDEPAKIGNSSKKSGEIKDEPANNGNSSNKSAKIVDELVERGDSVKIDLKMTPRSGSNCNLASKYGAKMFSSAIFKIIVIFVD